MDWNGSVETCYINLWKCDIINGANEEETNRKWMGRLNE